jgi:hypothetical protein
MEMASLWKPQNGSHRDLEISHRTRDSHIPTARTLFSEEDESGQITCQTEADRSLVNNSRQWQQPPMATAANGNSRQWHRWFRFAPTPRRPRISVVPWLAELTEELT